MRNDRHLAIKLRKKGMSYNEISKELDVPKSTMHYWFRGLRWSKNIKKKLTERAIRLSTKRIRAMAQANKKRWEEWREQYRKEATKEFPSLKLNPLFIAGLMLYWGEGDTVFKNGIVRLANTKHRMIALFSKFLQKICRVPKEKINIWLLLYPDLSEIKCKNFWSHKTGIPITQFRKSQIIQGKHPTKRLENGVCTIQVNSRGLKEKVMVWIDLFSRNLVRV